MRRPLLIVMLSALCLLCFFAPDAGAETVALDGIAYEIKDGYAYMTGLEEGAVSITLHTSVNGYPVSGWMDAPLEKNTSVREMVLSGDMTSLDSPEYYFSSLIYACTALERLVLPAAMERISPDLSYFGENLKEFAVAEDNALYRDIDGVLYSRDGKVLLSFPNGKSGQYDMPQGTKAIGQSAFRYNERLTQLVIPEGVTRLDAYALSGLAALLEIELPASLEELGAWGLPFESLKSITVAEGSAYFASVDGVLYSRDLSTLIVYPGGREGHFDMPPGTGAIAEGAFGSNRHLTSLTVPEGMTELPAGALSGMSKMERLYLPASLTAIGADALPGFGALASVTVADGNAHFQGYDGALFSRDGKTLLYYPAGRGGACEIPAGTLAIAPGAFRGNEGITSLTVPDGVTSLPPYLLSGAGALEEMYLPASLAEMGEFALPTGGVLRRVEVTEGSLRYRSVDGVLFEGEELILYPPLHGRSYDIPAGTASIRKEAFANCRMLETVSIPRSMTEIAEAAFYSCIALERVSLPITLTKIGRSAFGNCISLSGILLPPGLLTLEGGAFYNCPLLGQVHIPDNVAEIDGSVFAGHGPDFALIASKGSAGYWHAWEYELPWSEPGGMPGTLRPTDRQTQSAVVNNPGGQELLDLYAKPSAGSKSLGAYRNGTTVQVVDTQGEWAHVQLYGAEGYMSLDALMLTDKYNSLTHITWGRKRREDAPPLMLYEGPSEEAPSDTILEDVSMRILDTVGVWYLVDVQGRQGYVPGQNLHVVHSRTRDYDTNITYFVVANPNGQDRLHLRREPSTKSESLGRYFNGTQVEVIPEANPMGDWRHVRVDGKEGYMMAEYLQSIDWGGEASLWWHG